MLSEADVEDHYNPSVRLIEIDKNCAQCGFQLTRGKWDPYPWVSSVDEGTAAAIAGLKPGDCVLEVNREDVVGKRISEIAEIVKTKPDQVSLLLWNAGVDPHCTPEALCCGPLPKNLQRLTACMSTILTFLECPICLDMILPPTYQCDNGHLICIRCRAKSERCPICRIRLSRGRSLIADQIYHAFIDAFHLKEESEGTVPSRIQQIFKQRFKKGNIPDIKITQSHTNKILAKIIGKATSVDNLAPNSKLLSPIDTSDTHGARLKVKSLSTNEIFVSESPVISRHGSVPRLSNTDTNNVKVDELNNKSASYHGFYDSLERKIDLTVSPIYICLKADPTQNDILYNCPFSTGCKMLLKGSDIFVHFQSIHSENGPLVQYFNSVIEICLKDFHEQQDLCNVIFSEGHVYFLKIFPTKSDSNESLQSIQIWMWYLGNKDRAKDYEIRVEIKHPSLDDVLLSLKTSVFSLSTTSSQDIIQSKKGIFLSGRAIEALEFFAKKILLKAHILQVE